jgi:pimeloyl-ACP methyl ester carboxylesterase
VFSRAVQSAFRPDCPIESFIWSGKNNHADRIKAAEDLKALIETNHAQRRRVHIVGHSHGGNVALLAANLLPAGAISTLVLLATPHIALLYKDEQRCHWLYWGATAQKIDRIWNLYSPDDKVQSVGARLFHGVAKIRKSSPKPAIAALRTFDGEDSNRVLNGIVRWENGRQAHSAMHSAQMGTVVGHLLAGEQFTKAMHHAGLSIEEPNDIRDIGW